MSTATVGVYEAKTHLPRLLKAVEEGETITVTKHGRPIAQIVPFPAGRRGRNAVDGDVSEEFRRLREEIASRPGYQPITQAEWRTWSREGLA